MKTNFTANRVAGFTCLPGRRQTIHWDAKTPGLGLRVTECGTRSYVFEARICGKTMRCTIGDARTWAVGNAQKEATRLKSQTDLGTDPRQLALARAAADESNRKENLRHRVTVAEAWRTYIDQRNFKWSRRHALDHFKLARCGGADADTGHQHEPGALSALMPLRLRDVNADVVRAWLRDEAARRPTQAALAFRLLRAFLNWCADTPAFEGITSGEACSTRIAKDILPRRKPKTDCLKKEQLATWFGAVRTIANPVIFAYLQTLLLTGSRREELAGLRWPDVDFRWKAFDIHDKVEGSRTVPLTPYVGYLLAGLPRRNEWVFSSLAAASGHLQEPSIQHRKVCHGAGIDELTLHGLRRSFSTLSEWVEAPVGVVAQIMGHKPSATAERHYKVRPLDLLRQWHTKIESWILKEAGIEVVSEPTGLRLVGGTA